MSILLILCVLAAAGWLVLSVRSRGPGDDPGDTVAAYSRAMAALNPTEPIDSRGRPQRTQRPRRPAAAQASRPVAGTPRRPASHRTAGRARPTAARSRPVRR